MLFSSFKDHLNNIKTLNSPNSIDHWIVKITEGENQFFFRFHFFPLSFIWFKNFKIQETCEVSTFFCMSNIKSRYKLVLLTLWPYFLAAWKIVFSPQCTLFLRPIKSHGDAVHNISHRNVHSYIFVPLNLLFSNIISKRSRI